MLSDNDIIGFLNTYDYDIRKTGSARWIDQKCTPDVLWSIADFIIDYVDRVATEFTVRDIWNSDYAKETIDATFSKPNTNEKKSKNEYDKFFSQPLNLLCYAHVLNDISKKNGHLYIIENRDVLEYIARNDMCALKFICMYNEKVMYDSGLMDYFNYFFEKQDKTSFNRLKENFIQLYYDWTPVKGQYEPKRIFTKVINPLAYKYKKCGTEKGHLSKTMITKADLMYNQDNFRDVYKDKPKNVSRNEWLKNNPQFNVKDGYFDQQMNHAKKLLRVFNGKYRNNISELTMFNNDWVKDDSSATQIHHIFPKSDYPDIKHYLENLIALTPNQHFGFAHPNNNTQYIDPESQKELLLAKVASIKFNLLEETEKIYDFNNLKTVLYVGFNEYEDVKQISDNDFNDVVHIINYYYDELVKS